MARKHTGTRPATRWAAIAAAVLATLSSASAAAADDVYSCEGGAWVTFVDATNEALVGGLADGFSIALPFAGAMGRFATWSPSGRDAVGERKAPFVEYWQPASGPEQVRFNLGDGERHCTLAGRQ